MWEWEVLPRSRGRDESDLVPTACQPLGDGSVTGRRLTIQLSQSINLVQVRNARPEHQFIHPNISKGLNTPFNRFWRRRDGVCYRVRHWPHKGIVGADVITRTLCCVWAEASWSMTYLTSRPRIASREIGSWPVLVNQSMVNHG
jgi:hypothetical protein